MRVFLTGATGFIGGAVARALMQRGHEVVAVVRASSADRLPAGATPCVGDLRDPAPLAAVAAGCDTLVHAAYEYDAAGREMPEADTGAVQLMLELLRRGQHVLYTSNAFLLDHPACAEIGEAAALPAPLLERQPRLQRERDICAAGGSAVRVGAVYGGRGGTMAMLLDALAAPRSFHAIDALANRWSLIYLEDLASLYVTIVEGGARGLFHGVDGVPVFAGDAIVWARAALAALAPHAPPVQGGILAARVLEGYRHVLGRDIALRPARARELGWAPRFASYREGAPQAVREWAARRVEEVTP